MRPSRSYTWLLLILFFGSLFAQGQVFQDAVSFHHIETGLTQSSKATIFEDSDGFLWLGTSNGIHKYDGTHLQEYVKSLDGTTGISFCHVENIYEDEDHLLYIGTDQGLNIYDRMQDKLKPYPFKNDSLLIQSQNFKSVTKTGNVLWFGTYANGLYRYDIESGETSRLSFDEDNEGRKNNNTVLKIAALGSDRLLMITQAAIYIINSDLRILKNYGHIEYK